LKILFVDFSTRLKTVDDLETGARGGMVSSLFHVPEYLAKRNQVAVWSDIERGSLKNDVRWYTIEDYDAIVAQKWDFVVFNRGISNGLPELKVRHRIMWTHDMVHGGHVPNPKMLNAFSGVVFMSKYAEMTWRLHYPDIGRSFFIPNGVDRDLFYPREKNLDYVIYISAPNRGFSRLGMINLAFKKKVERSILFRAYSNMEILHPGEPGKKFIADLDNPNDPKTTVGYTPHISDLGERYETIFPVPGECGVEVLNPIPQKQLAEELGSAGLMIIPTDYAEICSNAVLQSLASGTPIITTDIGSVGEWVKSGYNGHLTKTTSFDYVVYLIELTRLAIGVLNNEKKHRRLIKNASKTKGIYTWDQIGSKWQIMLGKLH